MMEINYSKGRVESKLTVSYQLHIYYSINCVKIDQIDIVDITDRQTNYQWCTA